MCLKRTEYGKNLDIGSHDIVNYYNLSVGDTVYIAHVFVFLSLTAS